MDNTEVVCFVKYYDKKFDSAMVRRYVILKTYTVTELEAIRQDKTWLPPETISLHSEGDSAPPAKTTLLSPPPNKQTDSQPEFFTPTTSKILEQVSQHSTLAPSSSSASPNAERSISFGTITAEDLQDAAFERPNLQTPAAAETPKKKNKGQESNV